MKNLMMFLKTILNPFRVPTCLHTNTSGSTGGYSDSSPSDLNYFKILKGFNLNNRGCQPTGDKREEFATLKGLNIIKIV
jgi:hypothetical protein